MHYYGTYAMARAAGLTRDASRTIATAAQFVDDNASKDNIGFKDGARLDSEATAHHAYQIKNIDLEDQRRIWVPFHFLPGNEGDSFTERLICRKDSRIAREMIRHSLRLAKQPYALPLMGIAAHVYADTFSHYGFSGISSRRNKIKDGSIAFLVDLKPGTEKYIRDKEKAFRETYTQECGLMDNVKSFFAENLSGALGHGDAVTFPDRPYLKWGFEYEDPEKKSLRRNNPKTFLKGCEVLHRFFRRFAMSRPEYGDENFSAFPPIRALVEDVLKTEARKSGRIRAWQEAAKSGRLFASGPEPIPRYNADLWHNQRDNLSRRKDSSGIPGLPVYRFYQAASVHRNYVLRDLLPSHGLVVT